MTDLTNPSLMIKNNKLYDALKFLALVLLPAIGTLYFALAQSWGWTNGGEVVGTIVAVDTALGAVLHISSATYNNSEAKYDGTIDVTENETSKSFTLNLNGDPDNLDKKSDVTFKVNPVTNSTKLKKKIAAKRTAPRKTGSQ